MPHDLQGPSFILLQFWRSECKMDLLELKSKCQWDWFLLEAPVENLFSSFLEDTRVHWLVTPPSIFKPEAVSSGLSLTLTSFILSSGPL
jgi:hypothetical protein